MAARTRVTRLLLTTDAVGGIWQYSLDLAVGLADCGVQTTLAVLGPAILPDQRASACAIPALQLVETGLPLDWISDNPADVRQSGFAIARLAVACGAEIVQLNTPALAAEVVFTIPIVALCHSCVSTWWRAVGSGSMPADFIWRSALVQRGYFAAQLLIAPSQSFANATQAAYGLVQAPHVVVNARTPRSAPAAQCPPARLIFTAGRLWDRGKNLATLDRIAARLSIPVLAAGPACGPHGERIVLSHVRMLGRLNDDEVARWLACQPIFVSTSRYEPFGLAVLEAAQAGCALLLADIPTFRELWNDAALFLPPSEVEAAAVMTRVANDAAERTTLGRRAQIRASTFSVAAMAQTMAAHYDAVRHQAAA